MNARLEASGFECVDFRLVNPFTNYYEKPETGT